MPSTTPLHVRVLQRDFPWVHRYIESGLDLDVRDSNGNTALHHASLLGETELVVMLIDHGANVHAATVSGYTPLHKAAVGGHVRCIEHLLRAKSNVLATTHVGWFNEKFQDYNDVNHRMEKLRWIWLHGENIQK